MPLGDRGEPEPETNGDAGNRLGHQDHASRTAAHRRVYGAAATSESVSMLSSVSSIAVDGGSRWSGTECSMDDVDHALGVGGARHRHDQVVNRNAHQRSIVVASRFRSPSSTSLQTPECSIMPRCPQSTRPRVRVEEQLQNPVSVRHRREEVILASDHRGGDPAEYERPRTRPVLQTLGRSRRSPPAASEPASR